MVAWIPQSTVGILINKGYRNIHANLPEVRVRLQVHDSLAGTYPTEMGELLLPRIMAECSVALPYKQPIVIPVDVRTSEVSWGACG